MKYLDKQVNCCSSLDWHAPLFTWRRLISIYIVLLRGIDRFSECSTDRILWRPIAFTLTDQHEGSMNWKGYDMLIHLKVKWKTAGTNRCACAPWIWPLPSELCIWRGAGLHTSFFQWRWLKHTFIVLLKKQT